jgi:predicted RNA-binding protein with PIN domain
MFLIDGYNLLFAGGRVRRDRLPEARKALLHALARYCEVCGQKARIIFDYSQGPPPSRARLGAVEVCFTPKGVSADEEILGMIEGTSDRTAFTLVTSDREVADPARKKSVKVIGSESFRREMEKVLKDAEEKTDEAPEKGKGLGAGEVDYWMRQFGLRDEDRK